MNSIIVEIRGAEGGDHSKLLVKDMATTYRKVCEKKNLELSVIEDRPGFMSLLIEGAKAGKVFANEPGGHRWQNVSPTDKKGRVHTSTVTVAVLDEETFDYRLDLTEVEYFYARGSGKGGQHKNKTDSCVTAVHKPTGTSVKIDSRDQHKNKKLATRILAERLREVEEGRIRNERFEERKSQVGSGMRGDKRRTYRAKDDQVVDHIVGKTWRLKKWMRGQW
jgi:peptide chain release factor 1